MNLNQGYSTFSVRSLVAVTSLLALVSVPDLSRACELKLVYPEQSTLKRPVQAQTRLDGDILVVRFSVKTPKINAKRTLAPGEFPYMFDVVELFVSVSETRYPYFEFELSPFNQPYQVLVPGPGQKFKGGVDLGMTHSTQIVSGGWVGEMRIPLKNLGWNGQPQTINGNLYAILGKGKRSFWSAFLPQLTKANFHQPKYFAPLLQACGAKE